MDKYRHRYDWDNCECDSKCKCCKPCCKPPCDCKPSCKPWRPDHELEPYEYRRPDYMTEEFNKDIDDRMVGAREIELKIEELEKRIAMLREEKDIILNLDKELNNELEELDEEMFDKLNQEFYDFDDF